MSIKSHIFNPFEQNDCVNIIQPVKQTIPMVVASPHSGRNYSVNFIQASRLTPLRLRSSEDCFIEEIFFTAPELGAPLINALFPRVYVDVNREPFELDPAMFSGPLPDYVTTRNARIAAGLGTIPRVVSNSEEIYRNKLDFAEVEQRIHKFYYPYHQALTHLISKTQRQFGYCILLDCHSMPSGIGGLRNNRTINQKPIDIVLGDCHATSCDPAITTEAEKSLINLGYTVRKNNPYAGGFVTRHYGRPKDGFHTLQIEINRALYMDEMKIERLEDLQTLSINMKQFMASLAALSITQPSFGEAAE